MSAPAKKLRDVQPAVPGAKRRGPEPDLLGTIMRNPAFVALGVGGTKATAKVDRVLIAMDIATHLERLMPVPMPDRPEALCMSDLDLITALRKEKYRDDEKRGKDAPAKIGKKFGLWAYAVYRAELENGVRLRQIMWAARLLRGAEGSEIDQARTDLFVFAKARYGVEIDPIPPQYPWHVRDLTIRRDVLSGAVRHLDKTAAQGEESDDDAAG